MKKQQRQTNIIWDQIGLRVPRFESRMHSQHQRLVINQESRGGKTLEGITERRWGVKKSERGIQKSNQFQKTMIIMML